MDEKTLEWLYLDSDSLIDFDYSDIDMLKNQEGEEK